MRKWIIAPTLIGALFLSSSIANAASDHYSSLPYRSKEGWYWNPDNGMWVNPEARYDRDANKWVHDSRIPSSTACCDSTGLWVPGDAGNDPDVQQPPKRKSPQLAIAREESSKPRKDTVEDQVEKVRQMGLTPEVEQQVIERLRSGVLAPKRKSLREAIKRWSREQEARNAVAADAPRDGVAYGRTVDDNTTVREEPPTKRRTANKARQATVGEDFPPSTYELKPGMHTATGEIVPYPEADTADSSMFSGVGDFLSGAVGVAAALAPVAGAAAGLAASRSSSSSNTTVRYTQPAQAPRPPTQYPRAPEYGRSTISGIK